MGTIRDEFPHKLSEGDALKRMQLLTGYWQKKHGLTGNWNGGVGKVAGKVMGITFDATITVGPKSVIAEGTDPGFLFRSKAKEYLAKKITEYLDASASEDALSRRGED
jgi:hypothetical protein